MATITTAGSGNWSSTTANAPWPSGIVPVLGDKVTIANGHTVTVDGTYSVGDDASSATLASNALVINSGGTLIASRSVSSSLTVRGTLAYAGTLDYGTTASPIPSGVTATLIANDSATLAAGKHGIYASATTAVTKAVGVQRTRNTTLTASVSSGVNPTISVAANTNWAVGDRICIASDTTDVSRAVVLPIASISGLDVTLTGTLPNSRVAGCEVGNLSSNVVIKASSANFPGFWRIVGNGAASIDIADVRIENIGNTNGWAAPVSLNTPDYTSSLGIGSTSLSTDLTIYRVAVENTGTAGTYGASRYTSSVGKTICNDWALYLPATGCQAFYTGDSSFMQFDNCVNYRTASNSFNTGFGVGGAKVTVNNCKLFSNASSIAGSALDFTFNNCKLRAATQIIAAQALQSCVFNNCDILAVRPWGPSSTGGFGTAQFYDCTFNGTPLTRNGNTTRVNESSHAVILRPDGVTNDYRDYNWHYYARTDTVNIYRGQTSLKINPEQSGTPFNFSFTMTGTAGVAKRYIGYLYFDATYGTGTLPTLTFTGPGISNTFAPTATTGTWQKFDVTLTPSSTGAITVTLTGQSSSTAGFVYLDGLPFFPFIQAVRHYGFLFDANDYRTVDPIIQQTNEATVAAYTGIAINHGTQTITLTANHTVRELYDYIKYDLCQPANLAVADPFTSTDGVNFTSTYNIVITGCSLTGTGAITTSGTLTVNSGGTSTPTIAASNGTTGYLTITGLSAHAVYLEDGAGSQLDYQASVTGSYSYFIPNGSTGTWKYVIKKPGYAYQVGTLAASLGGAFNVSTLTPQKLTPDGLAMYTGTTDSNCQVTFSGSSQASIDIGDASVLMQAAFDMTEVALATNPGLIWLATRGECSIFRSASGNYLFLSNNWRVRRWHVGDVQATLLAYVSSTQGIVKDAANGDVVIFGVVSASDIADAVLAAMNASPPAVNIKQVNDITVKGVGTTANPWNPA